MKTRKLFFLLLLFPALSWGSELPEHDILYQLNGQDNEIFSITFTYLPREKTDPAGVMVMDLAVSGGGILHEPVKIASGTALHSYTGYTQFFRRTDAKKDMTVTMDLEGRKSLKITVPAAKPQDIVPVGTVVQSTLSWPEYVRAANDEPEYDPTTSQWAPCDGRSIKGSKLQRDHGSGSEAPDLRGVFLRGLNKFDPDEPESDAVDPKQRDPGPRDTEGFQDDDVGKHEHVFYGGGAKKKACAKQGNDDDECGLWSNDDFRQTYKRNTDGGPKGETRPNNIAVHYYVKIN